MTNCILFLLFNFFMSDFVNFNHLSNVVIYESLCYNLFIKYDT